jgi:NADP-dependent 3-hydroxy acid dehydrogenase YdfG
VTAELSGRSAVVTGASRGIGAATARSLAAAGARVVLLARTEPEIAALASQLGGGAVPIAADLTDPGSLEAAVGRVRDAIGVPDILVNNAGIFRAEPAVELPVEVFVQVIEINLVAPFRVIHAFLPDMLARRSGHVVNIGSVADRHAFPGNIAYSPSKFGLRGMHEVLRAELRGTGVRATLVSPGAVDTDLWAVVESEAPPGRFTARSDMLQADAVAAAIRYAVAQPPEVHVEEVRLRRA